MSVRIVGERLPHIPGRSGRLEVVMFYGAFSKPGDSPGSNPLRQQHI